MSNIIYIFEGHKGLDLITKEPFSRVHPELVMHNKAPLWNEGSQVTGGKIILALGGI